MLRRSAFGGKLLAAAPFSAVNLPPIANEPMQNFEPGSVARKKLEEALARLSTADPVDIPCIINGKEYRQGPAQRREVPHQHQKTLATFYNADEALLKQAVKSSLEARRSWSRMPAHDRLAIVLKAANIISGPRRYEFLAATMIGQGKNAWQGEIDAVAETVDFLRFNSKFAEELYECQPLSPAKANHWNSVDYRPLEGFVLAVSPFNFTAIGANLAMGPAMMGNTVLWKPSPGAILANYLTMKVFEEAGLPPGVINFVPSTPDDVTKAVVYDSHLAAVAFTGSTKTFAQISSNVANNLAHYKTFPRLSGETGGKNFHLIHPSAHLPSAVACTLRSAFEYQGQKCSACSRAYVPKSMWPAFKQSLLEKHAKLKSGPPTDFSSFICSVIDEAAFNKITGYIDGAKRDPSCSIIGGGSYSRETGWFVQPTIIETTNPKSKTMVEEIFGPVLTVYVYDDSRQGWENEIFQLIDTTTAYALTGAVFSTDRQFLRRALDELRDAAGNIYLNDKSTGAVVGMQPFGGARLSGTNDKAGAPQFLNRWVSPRTIKDTFDNLTEVSYPHQLPDVV